MQIFRIFGVTSRGQLKFPADATKFPFTRTLSTDIKDYKLDFGIQYTQQWGKKNALTLGAVFSPKRDLNNTTVIGEMVGNTTTGSTYSSRDSVATFGLPMTVGVGLAYVYDKRLTVGADFMMQQWDKVSYLNDDNAFCSRMRVGVGAEYIPNLLGRSYLSHIKYRVGAYYSLPYYKIDGQRAAKEFGVSAGFGLPIPRTGSFLSVTAQYARTKGSKVTFVDENTLRLVIGVTFNERWFFKRKVD